MNQHHTPTHKSAHHAAKVPGVRNKRAAARPAAQAAAVIMRMHRS